VVPVKFNAPVMEAHVYRQAIRMAVRLLYRADVSFPWPLGSIQHPHQRADTRLTRFQAFASLPFTVWGQTHTLAETQALTPTVFPFLGRI
jgi:hypothetical protein